jgi:Fe-S-cluster-containing dehydrogenase component
MTYVITNQCIGCSRCATSCPTGAITQTEQQYQINPQLCNDCVGHHSVPQCWAACPTANGCVPDWTLIPQSQALVMTGAIDYWERWFETYNRLIGRLQTHHQADYWQQWFDRYSHALSRQLHPSKLVEVTP